MSIRAFLGHPIAVSSLIECEQCGLPLSTAPRERRGGDFGWQPGAGETTLRAMAFSSTMLALGTPAPDFALPCVETGRAARLADFAAAKALVMLFLCNHCPYVVHVRPELARIRRDYAARDVAIAGITANDIAQGESGIGITAARERQT